MGIFFSSTPHSSRMRQRFEEHHYYNACKKTKDSEWVLAIFTVFSAPRKWISLMMRVFFFFNVCYGEWMKIAFEGSCNSAKFYKNSWKLCFPHFFMGKCPSLGLFWVLILFYINRAAACMISKWKKNTSFLFIKLVPFWNMDNFGVMWHTKKHSTIVNISMYVVDHFARVLMKMWWDEKIACIFRITLYT